MKKLLLVLLVVIGLQTQAQVSWCDSLSYTVVPGTQLLTVIGNSSLSPNMVDSMTWSWQACNAGLCFGGSGDTASFSSIAITDTVKLCYDVIISFMGATYVCTSCDSLVYDGFAYSWMLMNMGNPLAINELQLNTINNNKIYDLLGRELNEIPVGTMYIRNRKLHITK